MHCERVASLRRQRNSSRFGAIRHCRRGGEFNFRRHSFFYSSTVTFSVFCNIILPAASVCNLPLVCSRLSYICCSVIRVTSVVCGEFDLLNWKYFLFYFSKASIIYSFESKSQLIFSPGALSPADASVVIRPQFISSSP